jgi:hypothetical protein
MLGWGAFDRVLVWGSGGNIAVVRSDLMTQYATATGTGKSTDGSLIASNRVEGTKVLDRSGKDIGSIKRLKIDNVSGRVAYAVAEFGGFLGMGGHEYTIPWGVLEYDPGKHAFRTDLTKERLEGAPKSSHRSSDHAFRASAGGVGTGERPETLTSDSAPDSDLYDDDLNWNRDMDREMYDYYAVAYYWDE